MCTCAAAAVFVLVAGSAAAPSCTSSIQGDSTSAACFGWCGAAFATEHCKWCKCRGCPFCAQQGSTPSAQPLTPAALAAISSSVSAAACKSTVAGDSDSRDCQPFCSADFASEHCTLCKCRACGFCGCTSEVADDVAEAQCQDWCSPEYAEDHCKQCKCRDCEFCKHGGTCTPAAADDSDVERCDTFCDAKYAGSHCSLCKCKYCGFCKAAADAAAAGTSAVSLSAGSGATAKACASDAPIGVWDSDVEKCEPFCDAKEASSHCKLCKCRACDLCRCHSPFADDSRDEQCEPWCSLSQWTSHCQRCKCKACDFCREGVSCRKSGADDSEIEKCEPFCSKMFASTHCDMCKCKGCSFCRGKVVYPPGPPSPPRPPNPPPAPLHLPAPPPEPAGAHGSPEPPHFVTAPSTTCASVTISWHAPSDKGSPIDRYEVLYKRPSQPSPQSFPSLGKRTTVEVTGLAPATTYQLRVRAHNGAGFGMLSTPVTATTAPPLRPPPDQTSAPTVVSPSTSTATAACDAVELSMPPLRAGCSGDEFFTLQWREARWAALEAAHHDSGDRAAHGDAAQARTTTTTSSGASAAAPSVGWQEWRASDGSSRVPSNGRALLRGVVLGSAYQVRVLAHNSVGAAARPSPPSPPFTVGLSPDATGKPPRAVAISSAVVELSWADGASPCRPMQTWELLVNRPLGDAPAEWTTVRRGITGTALRLASSRCPRGCRFRVHAEGVHGWTVYSNASAVVRTPAEPPIPPLGCRVELATSLPPDLAPLVEGPPQVDAAGAASSAVESTAHGTGRQLAQGIAEALNVDSARVQLVAAYVAPPLSGAAAAGAAGAADAGRQMVQYVVIDLLPCLDCGASSSADESEFGDLASRRPSAGSGASGHASLATADDLAAQLARLMAGRAREIYARASTQGILPSTGLVQIHDDGSTTALWSTSAGKEEDEALLSEARTITVMLVVGAGLLGFCLTARNMVHAERAGAGGLDEEKERLQAE